MEITQEPSVPTVALVLLSTRELPGIEPSKSSMHPLETLDRWRRRWFGWLPKRTHWDKEAKDLVPDRYHDWLLEPLDRQEASALFPHLSEESAVAQYQKNYVNNQNEVFNQN